MTNASAVAAAYAATVTPTKCSNCGSTALQPAGTCCVCLNCGTTTGCS